MIGIAVYISPETFGQFVSTAWTHGKMSCTMDLNTATGQLEPFAGGFSLSEKTFWMLFIVGVTQFLGGQFDQGSIQRWCSVKSAKEARKAIFVLGFSAVPVWASFMFVGTIL